MAMAWLENLRSDDVKNLHIALIAAVLVALIVASNWMATQTSTVDFLKTYYNSKVVKSIINIITLIILAILFYHATETKSENFQMIYGGLFLLLAYIKYLYYTNDIDGNNINIDCKKDSWELFLNTLFHGLALGVGLTQLALD